MANANPSPDTRFGGPNSPKPGRPKGSKNKSPLEELETGAWNILRIPLAVIDTEEDAKRFRELCLEAVRKQPLGYLKNIVIPIAKLLPQEHRVRVFGGLLPGPDDMGPELRLALVEVIERRASKAAEASSTEGPSV